MGYSVLAGTAGVEEKMTKQEVESMIHGLEHYLGTKGVS